MHRTSMQGTYRIDRVFPGIGRIARASGATTRDGFQKRDALLTRLYDRGHGDVLRAIRDGRLTVTEVFMADREGRLDTLTGDRALLAAPLWATVRAWIPRSALAPATRRRYAVSFTALERMAVLGPAATVEDVGAVDWTALRVRWTGGPADWNHLRRAVSRFLTLHLGDVAHPLRRTVMRRFPKAAETPRVPDIPLPLFWRIVQEAPEAVRPAYVTLAATGLRLGEYLALTPDHLLPHSCSIAVPGTKTAASKAPVRVDERLWPWVVAAVPCPVREKWLRKHWKRALRAAKAPRDLRLHDLRHAYAQWAVNAGAPEAWVQVGLRHSSPAMTRRYAMQRDRGELARVMGDVLAPKALPPAHDETA